MKKMDNLKTVKPPERYIAFSGLMLLTIYIVLVFLTAVVSYTSPESGISRLDSLVIQINPLNIYAAIGIALFIVGVMFSKKELLGSSGYKALAVICFSIFTINAVALTYIVFFSDIISSEGSFAVYIANYIVFPLDYLAWPLVVLTGAFLCLKTVRSGTQNKGEEKRSR